MRPGIVRPAVTFLLGAVLATLACSQGPVAVKVRATDGRSGVWIVKDGKSASIPDSETLTPLSWSSDGRWLALGRSTSTGLWRLSVVDTTAGFLIRLELPGDCSRPSWSPDGKRFVVAVAGSGLRTCDLAGSDPVWSPLSAAGDAPSWSPNGGRIAFAGPKGGPGVWTVGDDGSGARPVVKQTGAVKAVWSPDGRTLAIVSRDKAGVKLSVVEPGGRPKELVPVGKDDVSWAPNASSLAYDDKGEWAVYGLKSGQAVHTGLHGPHPQWLDSDTLASAEDGKLVQTDVGTRVHTPVFYKWPAALPEGRIEAFTVFRGLVLDGSFDSPWKEAPVPKPGQIRIVGTVEDIELTEDTAVINVWSVLTPDRMELNLSRPIKQTVRMTTGSLRPGSKGNVPLSAFDLSTDQEVLMVVTGAKAGVPEALDVAFALTSEFGTVEATVDPAVTHPPRALEYDGVSMDVAEVPLVFPVVGKVNWDDTFLASRGGGRRRHHGQDLMAPRMRPLVAVFDGTVQFNQSSSGHNTITVRGDNGWGAVYMHVNNDHPGTDDGNGGARYAFAPGLKNGDRVVQGQLVGFCGDSGNAEDVGPHCHFELHDFVSGGVLNAYPSLKKAEHLDEPEPVFPRADCEVKTGEVRWDVVVVKVERERNVVVGELITSKSEALGTIATCFPKQVFIRLADDTKVCLRSDAKEARKPDSIVPGAFLTAVGPEPKPNESLAARFVGIGVDMSH